MSLSSESMTKLMAYADGELDGAERAEAETLIAADADATRFVEQIAQLGELVESGHEARRGKAIATFDVADDVMARLQVESFSKAADVVSLASRSRPKSSLLLKVGVAVAATMAVAASVFAFVRHRAEEAPMAAASDHAAPAGGASGTGVAIESAGNSVSVFYLPTANELSTSVVVWVDESGEK